MEEKERFYSYILSRTPHETHLCMRYTTAVIGGKPIAQSQSVSGVNTRNLILLQHPWKKSRDAIIYPVSRTPHMNIFQMFAVFLVGTYMLLMTKSNKKDGIINIQGTLL
jgi:hypothetical protein